jgi:hypothetical protein
MDQECQEEGLVHSLTWDLGFYCSSGLALPPSLLHLAYTQNPLSGISWFPEPLYGENNNIKTSSLPQSAHYFGKNYYILYINYLFNFIRNFTKPFYNDPQLQMKILNSNRVQ